MHELLIRKDPAGDTRRIPPAKGLVIGTGMRSERECTGHRPNRTQGRRASNQWNGNSTLTKLDCLTPPDLNQNRRARKTEVRTSQKGEGEKSDTEDGRRWLLRKNPKKETKQTAQKDACLLSMRLRRPRIRSRMSVVIGSLGRGGEPKVRLIPFRTVERVQLSVSGLGRP